ncbi:hypothetical protein LRP52_23950 [Photobacterium sp. ZSDE20]|uniref:ParB/Sulfiredoxin domain-containing protein n=1 Tax=Photobacterium pectinilyticum TaxID=2906793 RepID=A0ABT1N575_9GAMM|nr:hypothetical protein [Photobacterium sp. ZSDE20]MCQ1058389.1 hypothetical protein [Photobacterium sp. ZSDE20]MDD1825248.1 hypothetical protein [Photobacterium sp. ZSDE20]
MTESTANDHTGNSTVSSGKEKSTIKLPLNGKPYWFDLITLEPDQLGNAIDVSDLNPRNQTYVASTLAVADIEEDIKTHGQIMPAWGYLDKNTGETIVVDGSRRLQVALRNNLPYTIFRANKKPPEEQLKVFANSLSKTKELSLLERGEVWAKWIDSQQFNSYVAISKIEGISDTVVRVGVLASKLPEEIYICFTDPTTLGRPNLAKLINIYRKLDATGDLSARIAFKKRFLDEVDPDIISHELYTDKNKSQHKKRKKTLELSKKLALPLKELRETVDKLNLRLSEADNVISNNHTFIRELEDLVKHNKQRLSEDESYKVPVEQVPESLYPRGTKIPVAPERLNKKAIDKITSLTKVLDVELEEREKIEAKLDKKQAVLDLKKRKLDAYQEQLSDLDEVSVPIQSINGAIIEKLVQISNEVIESLTSGQRESNVTEIDTNLDHNSTAASYSVSVNDNGFNVSFQNVTNTQKSIINSLCESLVIEGNEDIDVDIESISQQLSEEQKLIAAKFLSKLVADSPSPDSSNDSGNVIGLPHLPKKKKVETKTAQLGKKGGSELESTTVIH